jgi:uncharacterized protein (DUF433 family)
VATRHATDFYGGREPAKVPAYTAREVADFLQLPVATVRAWTFGTTYGRAEGRHRFRPVIKPADVPGRLLSFENLVEVHVLSSLRRQHEVKLPAVRRAVEFLRRQFKSDHPLAEREMSTDGTSVFVEHYGRLVNASSDGQEAMREIVQKYLTRVDRSPKGQLLRLYPITRARTAPENAPKVVAIDPRYRFGQPYLVGYGVETHVIADRHRAGDSVKELARDFDVSEDAIEEALRYELRAAS